MDYNDLNLIRNKQNQLKFNLKQLESVKQRILELKQDDKVREFYQLIKFIEENSVEEIEKKFNSEIDKILIYTKNSNKILYDYGFVSVITYENYGCEYESDLKHVYRDLETTEYYFEMIDTIESMPPEWRVGYNTSDVEYERLRQYFIGQIQFRSQEDVIEELLCNNKQLVKGK